MRVHLKSLYAGPLGSYGPGDCDVPIEIAQDLIRAEVAVALPAVVETRKAASAPDLEVTQKMPPPSRTGKKAKPVESVASDD
jgi:hypothetical protein